jgi:2-hydroxychromene-2-carboxylate isomerase
MTETSPPDGRGEPLQVWFEFASTYSYPAIMRVEAVAREAGVALAWKPFLLGPIFAAQGWNDSPFNIYPVKGRYMWRDLERLCAKYGLPLRRPSRFPRPSLLAARVACVGAGEPWGGDFIRAVYHANFAEDRDIADAKVVGALVESVGQPAAAVLERAQSAATKLQLREHTEEATRLGIFGAPTFVAAGELFWGNDRLEDALAWLSGGAARRRVP